MRARQRTDHTTGEHLPAIRTLPAAHNVTVAARLLAAKAVLLLEALVLTICILMKYEYS